MIRTPGALEELGQGYHYALIVQKSKSALVDLCLLSLLYCSVAAIATYGHLSVTDKKLDSVLATAHFRPMMSAAEKRKGCT
jgi:hypothetical protein